MEIKAKAKFIRISPTKVRLAIGLVRGLTVDRALDQMIFSKKWAAKPVAKLINSAIANAINNHDLERDNLFVKEIQVNEGPKLKRWMPKAHGRATPLLKRTSHIEIVLGEIKDSGIKAGKKVKLDDPVKLGGVPKHEGSVKIDYKEKDENMETKEQGKKKINASHEAEGRHGHVKVEGGSKKGFVNKLFQRKSG